MSDFLYGSLGNLQLYETDDQSDFPKLIFITLPKLNISWAIQGNVLASRKGFLRFFT